jgi:hypothetical protein
MKTGIQLISEERERQICKEGWSELHDDDHVFGELADAAIVYADAAEALIRGDKDISGMRFYYMQAGLSKQWPWAVEYLKIDANPVRNLVKSGALIAAEIDRIQRESARRK